MRDKAMRDKSMRDSREELWDAICGSGYLKDEADALEAIRWQQDSAYPEWDHPGTLGALVYLVLKARNDPEENMVCVTVSSLLWNLNAAMKAAVRSREGDGRGEGDGQGHGISDGYGMGDGKHYGTGEGIGDGYGLGDGDGFGYGYGKGYCHGAGEGYGCGWEYGDGQGDGYGVTSQDS